jgi:hypothetical protein
MAGDEGASSQIEDQAAIHLLVESEVEVVEGLLRVAELGLLFSPLQKALATQGEFIGDQAGQQVDGGERFGLRLTQAGFWNTNLGLLRWLTRGITGRIHFDICVLRDYGFA